MSWSAEMYLRNSTGPMRQHFRSIVSDVDSLEQLDETILREKWKAFAENYGNHFAFNEAQQAEARAQLAAILAQAQAYQESSKEQIAAYQTAIGVWHERDAIDRWGTDEALWREKQKLESTRVKLVSPLMGMTKKLELGLASLLDENQRKQTPPRITWATMSQLDKVNFLTMWGLAVCGGCMILGLFSRLASLGTATLLTLFYCAMPPWPGLPPNPVTEGHYLFVNKNVVEWLACMVLVTQPTGVWGGLDALIRGLITRPLFGMGAQELRDQMDEANK